MFESLYAQETEVATHTDINDDGQTVSYKVGSLTVDMPGNSGTGISVKTGDNAPIFYAVGAMLMAIGAAVLVITIRKGKKKSEKTE